MRRAAAFALLAATLTAVAQAPPPKVLPHPETVYAVAFSPDGRTVATGGFDKVARLWDVASGRELRTLGGKNAHQNLVVGLTFTSDGSQLATTSTDNTAKIWDLPTTKPLAVRQNLGGQPVTRIAVSPDGKTFVTAAGLQGVRRWDAADEKKLTELGKHRGFVSGLAYSANGATLYTLGAEGVLKYWNSVDGKELGGIGIGGSPVGMWLNPASGALTTYSTDGTLRQWPAALPTVQALPNAPAKVRQALTTPDGTLLLLALEDQTIRSVNLASGEVKTLLDKIPPGYFQMSLHASNGTLAVETGGQVKLIGLDGKPRGDFSGLGTLAGFALHPTESKFVVVKLNGVVESWAIPRPDEKKSDQAPKALTTRPTVASAVKAVLLPQTNQAVVIDKDGAVAMWDTTAGQEAKKVRDLGKVGPQPNSLALSRDGTLVAAAGQKSLKVWQLADGKELHSREHEADVIAIAFNAEKTRLAVSTGNSTVTVYALPGGHAEQFLVHEGQVRGVAFHPAQPVLYTAGDDTTVRATPLVLVKFIADPTRLGQHLIGLTNGGSFLTTGTGEGVFRVNAGSLATEAKLGKAKAVTALAANKSNTLVAVADDSKTITIFNLNNPTESAMFTAPAKVRDLAFHPTRPQLAGALADNRVTTWHVAFDPADTKADEKRFGTVLQEVPHDRAALVLFTPDGNTLLTGGGDAALRSWKVLDDAARFNLPHPNIVNAAAFNKGATLFATGGQDGIVRVFDLTKPAGTAPKAINAHVPMAPAQPQPIYAVLFTPDGKQVISCSFDKSVKIHDATAGTLVKEIKPGGEKLPGHTDAVYALALSPDGKSLATGSADRTIKLWNPATGELIREFKNTADPKNKDLAHPGYVQGLKFTSDGTKLVSVGPAPKNKGYLAVWNVADGKQLSGQELDVGPIHAVDVRADGLLVLGCGPKVRNQSSAEAVLMPMPK